MKKTNTYLNRKRHWEASPSSIDGMLNGSSSLTNKPDIDCSNSLVKSLISKKLLNPVSVIDCGAGIGRVIDNVLLNYFQEIDMVEQDSKFIKKCKEKYLNIKKIKNIYEAPLQKFIFKKEYDTIWVNWCLENIDNKDIGKFLKRCYNALNKTGLMIVKENIFIGKGKKKQYYQTDDLSIVRREEYYLNVFKKAGFEIIEKFQNPNWPEGYMPTMVFVFGKSKE